jgi:hypothetical protein
MMRRTVPVGLAVGLVLAVVACDQLTKPAALDPYGFMVMNARVKSNGTYTTQPTAYFYTSYQINLASAGAAWDSCRVYPYDPTATSGGASYLQAGSSLGVSVSGHSDVLLPASATTAGPYNMSAAGMPFNPGDTVKLTIPGDKSGFPAATVLSKTAEPFSVDSLVTPVLGQGMPLKWTTPSDNNSAMLFSFFYSNVGGPTPNEEIYCSYVDNGADSVPAYLINKYVLSPYKRALVQRLRTAIYDVPGTKATFNVISTFDRPLPVSP